MHLNKRFELATGKKEDLTLTVSLKMAKCSSCGQFFTPERLLKKTIEKLAGDEVGPEAQEWEPRCPECRQARTAKALVGLEGMEHD
jgi:hydrogenase-4 component H